jgi:hypothetical protein
LYHRFSQPCQFILHHLGFTLQAEIVHR